MESFSLSNANQLSVSDAKEYIKRYFYPLASGLHVQVEYDEDGKPFYEIKEDKVIKSVYFNRLPRVIQDFYFREYDQIKTLTCELNKPFIFGKYINTCPAYMHEVKTYSDYSDAVKGKVELMLNFLKEIWASNNDKQYQFIIKWVANMARGGKNQSVLYLRAEQGIGKSTFTDFLRKHVIGSKLCIQSGSQPLISQFNAILFCKLLVIFEELENFSTNQWQGVSTRLKRDTTSDTCTYEDKFQKAFTAKNISNYIINANVDAIKDDDGRRYFILDLSNKQKGDHVYFNNIYAQCMNDEVGEAFFSYLQTIDLKGYHDQDFPATRAKEDAIVKRLDSVAKYIKEKYILRYKDFNTSLKDAFLEYVEFCSSSGAKDCCKIEFNKRLESLKITSYKCGNIHNKYNYTYAKLVDIASFNKWMHSTDQYEEVTDPFTDNNLDSGLNKDIEEKDAEIKALREQIEKMNNRAKFDLDKNIEVEPDEIVQLIIKDPYQIIISQLMQDKLDINDYLKSIQKPKKKKKNMIQLKKDIFELDFMCE